ncbi:MAG: hypothetical protein IKJ32_01250 [Clostridia bacterium]|nr:hypothetical protein [Clostridia bacterium]
MNKKIFYLVLFILLASVFCYLNRENIAAYFANKEWEIVETTGTTNLDNYYSIDGTSSNLIVVGNNYIHGYSSDAKMNFDESVSLKNAITDSTGDYCIVGEREGTKIYMLCANVKIWESEIQGTIHAVSVNKNGYAAVIYKQTGYKNLIKILSPQGDEVFTSYLASTYAIDAEISNDNKELAIAEINAEGITAEAKLKIIDINNPEEKNIKVYSMDDDALITNIEYTNKNELLVQSDLDIKVLKNEALSVIGQAFNNNTYYASVENQNNAIVVSKVENGLFDTKYKVAIIDADGKESEYIAEKMPTLLKSQKNNIAIVIENNLLVINIHGKLIRRSELSGNIKDICFFGDGNSIAIIYRDKIEFIKNV